MTQPTPQESSTSLTLVSALHWLQLLSLRASHNKVHIREGVLKALTASAHFGNHFHEQQSCNRSSKEHEQEHHGGKQKHEQLGHERSGLPGSVNTLHKAFVGGLLGQGGASLVVNNSKATLFLSWLSWVLT
eukprot:4243079-Amphidinium_carterae.1